MSQKSDKAITIFEIFLTFLFLGFTSFGGPIAHVAFFRETLIKKKKWLEEEKFADYLALCQFLPGPTSSQIISKVFSMNDAKPRVHNLKPTSRTAVLALICKP